MGILRQEPVAGMNRFDIANFGGADDAINLEVAFRAGRLADADGFIGELNVQRIGVGFGVDREGADAEFLAGADDAHGNLTPVGDQNLVEHGLKPAPASVT